MPTIPRLKAKRNPDNFPIQRKIYGSRLWKEMRLAKLMESPLCIVCEMEGKTTLAEEVHHLEKFTNGENFEEVTLLAYDSNNMLPLCKRHHWEIHNGYLRGAKSVEDIERIVEARKKEKKD